ncbi:MAG: hypothetical protein ACERKD_00840 [Prolixibacteraceae bacterium]
MFQTLLTVISLVLIGNCVLAQTPDTIFVYEEVHITDTIWVEEDLPVRDTTQFSPLNFIGPELFSSDAATIPKNCIYVVKNQNQATMKKAGLLAALFMTFHTATIAKNNWQLYAGNNNMWLEHHAYTLTNQPWIGTNVGLNYIHWFGHSNVFISAGGSFRYSFINASFQQNGEIDLNLSQFDRDFITYKTEKLHWELNSGLFTSLYYELALPLKLGIRLNKLEPLFGVDFSYVQFKYERIEATYHRNHNHFIDLGISGGFNYYFNQRWGITFEIIQGLANKDNNFNNGALHMLSLEEEYFKSLKSNCTLFFTF